MHISLLPVCINQNVLDISDYGEFISEGYFFSGGLGVWWMGYGGGGGGCIEDLQLYLFQIIRKKYFISRLVCLAFQVSNAP
jgi:hypothetical protein